METKEGNKLSTLNKEVQKPIRLDSTITIVCITDYDGYELIAHDINRISSLQSRIQKLFDEFMIVDKSPVEVDRIEVSHLSMTHVWRNK